MNVTIKNLTQRRKIESDELELRPPPELLPRLAYFPSLENTVFQKVIDE